jgi:hypothetical protein
MCTSDLNSIRLRRVTLIFVLAITFQFGKAQTSTYTSTAAAPGTWTGANWTCVGVCTNPSPATIDDAVVINHVITANGTITAFSVKIENAVNAQDARLLITGSGALTIGVGGLILKGLNDAGGNTEFAITGTGDTFIGGNVAITQDKNSVNYTKFRIGGGGVSSDATVTINGNLVLDYNKSSTVSPETEPEVNLGSTVGDAVKLTVSGNTSMTYNFEDAATSNNNLAINVANNSSIDFNGNLNMTMTNGGSNGRVRLTLEGDARVTVTGSTNLQYNDDNNNTDVLIELGTTANPANHAQLQLAALTLSSTANLTANNYVRALGDGRVIANGTITFAYTGTGASPSNQNRIEAQGNSIIEMHGNVINSAGGTFYYNGATTAIFSGSAAQNIPTNMATVSGTLTTYQKIQINNAAGVSLTAPTTAAVSVELTSGVLNTTTANILTLTDVATTTGGSMTSYIDGPVRKTCVSGNCGDTFFTLGDDNLWAPLSLSSITGETATTAFTVQYIKDPYGPGNTDGTFDHRSGFEHWLISTVGTTPTANLIFYWKDACSSEIEDADPTIPTLFMGYFDSIDSRWEKLTGSVIDGSSNDCVPGGSYEQGFITVPSVGSFGPFTFISEGPFDNPLPVELVGFSCVVSQNQEVEISWQTASEAESDFFTIQRTQDMKTWEIMDTVTGHGTTNEKYYYNRVDRNPHVGHNYYRLIQHDFNGSLTYSNVKFVNVGKTGNFRSDIYPNPIDPKMDKLILEINAKGEEPVFLNFISLDGIARKDVVIEKAEKLTEIDIADLSSGLYLIKIKSKFGLYSRKLWVVDGSSNKR